MPEPRVVTPQEAQERIRRAGSPNATNPAGSLLHTVATEPERIAAAERAARRSAWSEGWREGWVAAGGSLDDLKAHAEDVAVKRATENRVSL